MKARTVVVGVVLAVIVMWGFSKIYPAINKPIGIGTEPRKPACAGFTVKVTAQNKGTYNWSLSANGHHIKNGKFTKKGETATATVGPNPGKLEVSYTGTGSPASGTISKDVTAVAPCAHKPTKKTTK